MLNSVAGPLTVIGVAPQEVHNNGSTADNGGEDLVGVEELSPNTIKEMEVVMQHYDKEGNCDSGTKMPLNKERVESAAVVVEPAKVIVVVGEEIAHEIAVDAAKIVEGAETVAFNSEYVQSVATPNKMSSAVSEIKEVKPENADNLVLEVAREVAKLDLSSEKMDGIASAFKDKSVDDMKDSGVVKYYT